MTTPSAAAMEAGLEITKYLTRNKDWVFCAIAPHPFATIIDSHFKGLVEAADEVESTYQKWMDLEDLRYSYAVFEARMAACREHKIAREALRTALAKHRSTT